MRRYGIDIGGSGIKGALVETETGELLTERYRLDTPQPCTPEALVDTVEQIVSQHGWKGPVGCGFPGIVQGGVVKSAANLDKRLIGLPLADILSERLKAPVRLMNDADAAGMAEIAFAPKERTHGLVMMLTVGTGIGTALFQDGVLIPNTELGHMEWNGKEAELQLSEPARKQEKLEWQEWAERLDAFLKYLDALFSPNAFIIGGGGAKKPERFMPYLSLADKTMPAQWGNRAGIIGAALPAAEL